MSQVSSTKAAREVDAMNKFFKMMRTSPDMVAYGLAVSYTCFDYPFCPYGVTHITEVHLSYATSAHMLSYYSSTHAFPSGVASLVLYSMRW